MFLNISLCGIFDFYYTLKTGAHIVFWKKHFSIKVDEENQNAGQTRKVKGRYYYGHLDQISTDDSERKHKTPSTPRDMVTVAATNTVIATENGDKDDILEYPNEEFHPTDDNGQQRMLVLTVDMKQLQVIVLMILSFDLQGENSSHQMEHHQRHCTTIKA